MTQEGHSNVSNDKRPLKRSAEGWDGKRKENFIVGAGLSSKVEVGPADLLALVRMERLQTFRQRRVVGLVLLTSPVRWSTLVALVAAQLSLRGCQTAGLKQRHQLVRQLTQLLKAQVTLGSKDSTDGWRQGLQKLVAHQFLTDSHLASQRL
ncbi:hypothetical protein FJT64_021703 [Amphibalanus amphitrite]|uniref:Uncharacterized protein n=1 Tax=Amphibalanus amphitrite TaxID=1232801 RepID=A0A6A4WXN4_AMPAM|nr:hypothetical protein FJT64_021703 [Amphibalanus amphitrite]